MSSSASGDGDGGGDDGGDACAADEADREARGNLVVFQNDYFTLTRSRSKLGAFLTEAKIDIKPRWRTADEFRAHDSTKTITTSRLDGDLDPPTRTFAALKAWMLWRYTVPSMGGRRRSQHGLLG